MEIIEPVWKGLLNGLMFTLTFGNVYFYLIQTIAIRGLSKCIFFASDVLFIDAFYISLAIFGSTFITDKIEHYDHIIRMIGFCFLLFLGIRSIMKHDHLDKDENQPA